MIIPPVDPTKVGTVVGPVALEVAKRIFKNYFSKNHGSKVKMGEFADAKIEMYGDKACIKLNESGSQVLLLTSDNIQSYQYVKEKEKPHGIKLSTYYYYNIYFKDGTSSYVRMRGKYRDAMEQYT